MLVISPYLVRICVIRGTDSVPCILTLPRDGISVSEPNLDVCSKARKIKNIIFIDVK